MKAMAVPPNKSLQRTEQTGTRFACAKRAPVRSAAELGRYASDGDRLVIPKLTVLAIWTFLSCGYIYLLSFAPSTDSPSWSGFLLSSLILVGGGIAFHVFLRILAAPANRAGWLLVLRHAGGVLVWGVVVVSGALTIGTGSLGMWLGTPAFLIALVVAIWHAASVEQRFRILCGEVAEA